jgi:3-oxoacyl-[acyl-carrier-protein] synthase-1
MPTALAITGLAMVTSVGRDAASACGAIRAGITRPREIDYFQVLDDETQDVMPVVGHPIRGFAEGFNIVGLWTRLAKRCVPDALADAGHPDSGAAAFWRRTALVAATPYIDDDRFQSVGDETPELLREAYLRPLVADLALPIPESRLRAVCKGHAATVAALGLADTLLADPEVQRVLVLAADSYLDTMTLEWLAGQDRLKGPGNPVGLMPGEAGACLLLERPEVAERRGAPVRAVVEGVGVAKEAHDLFSGEPNRGLGLAEAASLALASANGPRPLHGDVIADLNGEEWRALELAGARLLLDDVLDRDCPLRLPAVSLGDVGAASGAVALAVAAQAFARGYATADQALVTSSSDHGDVAAACVRRPR